MLHKVNSTYRELAKCFPELKNRLSSPARKKQLLLEMAENNKDKPIKGDSLYYSLLSYTSPKSKFRDDNFDKKIRSLRPDWFMPRSYKKKQLLLKMAKDKEPKPSSAKTNLGKRLEHYLNPNRKYHDPIFVKQIKKLAPHWLVTHFDTAIQKRRQLLAMAKRKKPKPKQTTELGRALVNYTCKNSESNDPIFTKEIKKLAPHWFIPQSQSSEQNKKKLISMAKDGQPKPKTNTPIGARLNDYTMRSANSYTFDPIFTKEIKKLAPDWFISTSDKKKSQLLAMAGNGEPRPSQKTKLGAALSNYTRKNSESEDPSFTKQIRKLRPDWFVTQTEKACQNKRSLIRLAKNGEPKPIQKTPLGALLRNYTVKSSGSYDPTFRKNIKKIRPEWFVINSEKSKLKKQELMALARQGKPRPSQKTTSLGRALTNYTSKKSQSYDPTFDKQIRKLAPHWFKKCSTR